MIKLFDKTSSADGLCVFNSMGLQLLILFTDRHDRRHTIRHEHYGGYSLDSAFHVKCHLLISADRQTHMSRSRRRESH